MAVIDNEQPYFRQINPKGFWADDDTLYPEGSTFYWHGALNEYLEPLNDCARDKMRVYLQELEDGAKAAARKFGRDYTGRMTDLGDIIAQALGDARNKANGPQAVVESKLVMPTSAENAPMMPPRKRGRPAKIMKVSDPAPPPRNEPAPRTIGREDHGMRGPAG